jgi:hypothetical protein
MIRDLEFKFCLILLILLYLVFWCIIATVIEMYPIIAVLLMFVALFIGVLFY